MGYTCGHTGDQILSATVYFDNVTYEDARQIMEHVQAYKVKLCLKHKPEAPEQDPDDHPETIQVTILCSLHPCPWGLSHSGVQPASSKNEVYVLDS